LKIFDQKRKSRYGFADPKKGLGAGAEMPSAAIKGKESEMTRTLKALSLALLAVCAFGAVSASSASAVNDIFTCTDKNGVSVANCDITAEDSTKVTFGTKSSSFTVKCDKETYSATATKGAGSITVTPTYAECTSTVETNGCDYVLTGETTSNTHTTGDTTTDARVTLSCPAGKGIVIKGPGCTLTIGTEHSGTVVNHNLHGVTYDNEAGAGQDTKDIKVTVTVDTIAYTTTGFFCGAAGLPATGTDGTLTGSITAQGYVDGNHNTRTGILVETA
jgi:hypothetical protein